jgi:hypothetical protein
MSFQFMNRYVDSNPTFLPIVQVGPGRWISSTTLELYFVGLMNIVGILGAIQPDKTHTPPIR